MPSQQRSRATGAGRRGLALTRWAGRKRGTSPARPVLRPASPRRRRQGNQLLATFDCAGSRGGGVAPLVDDDDDDLGRATREAGAFCDDYDRIAVLQSVSELDHRRVAAFNCVNA